MSTVLERPPELRVNPSTGNYLTLRANRFIDHWLKTSNGTESARIAGYSGNENALAAAASRMLRNPKIAFEINRRLGRSILTADEVLEGLSHHARADLANVLEPDGSFDIRSAKRRGVSSLLKKLKTKTRYEKDSEGNITPVVEQEFEIHDSQAALVHLGKYHKLFIDQSESVNLNLDVSAAELSTILQGAIESGFDLAGVIDVTPESASQSDALHNEQPEAPQILALSEGESIESTG